MFCANCGKQLPDGTKFCGNCGAAQPQPKAGQQPKFSYGSSHADGTKSPNTFGNLRDSAAKSSAVGSDSTRLAAAVLCLFQVIALLLPAGTRMIYGTTFNYSWAKLMLHPAKYAKISVIGVLLLILVIAAALAQAFFCLQGQKMMAAIAGVLPVLSLLYLLIPYTKYDVYGGSDYFGKWVYPVVVIIALIFSVDWDRLKIRLSEG